MIRDVRMHFDSVRTKLIQNVSKAIGLKYTVLRVLADRISVCKLFISVEGTK